MVKIAAEKSKIPVEIFPQTGEYNAEKPDIIEYNKQMKIFRERILAELGYKERQLKLTFFENNDAFV